MKYIIQLLILSFCLIQIKSDKASQIIQFAKSKINCGYVYGATGQILNESNLKELKNRHPDKVDESIVRKWLGIQVFDCAGFVYAAFKTIGISLKTGATSIWNQKTLFEKTGTIDTLPKDKVCILFRKEKEGNGMAHTGIYILNGNYVHSVGSQTGVQPGKMNGSWTHWALLKGLYNGETFTPICSSYPCKGRVGNASGTVNLRTGPSTGQSIIIRVKVGELVTVNSYYQDGWYNISYDGKTGYMMADFLVKP